MKRVLLCITLVMAVSFVAVPNSSAAPERLTYHCIQDLATNVEPVDVRFTGVNDQVAHITQHGIAAFDCPGLGTGTTEIWLHGNLNPQLKGMLQGTDTITFTGGAGGFNDVFQAHGVLVPLPVPPYFVLTWTGKPVGHGFGTYDGWQLRGTQQRDVNGITWDIELFQPGS